MKKIVIVLVMFLAICSVFAYDLGIKGVKNLKTYPINREAFINIVCLEGYQYAVFVGGVSANLVQMFEGGLFGSQPIKCSQ